MLCFPPTPHPLLRSLPPLPSHAVLPCENTRAFAKTCSAPRRHLLWPRVPPPSCLGSRCCLSYSRPPPPRPASHHPSRCPSSWPSPPSVAGALRLHLPRSCPAILRPDRSLSYNPPFFSPAYSCSSFYGRWRTGHFLPSRRHSYLLRASGLCDRCPYPQRPTPVPGHPCSSSTEISV